VIKLWLGLRSACKEPEMEEIEPDLSGIPTKLVIEKTLPPLKLD
jgi:hypothetical protein